MHDDLKGKQRKAEQLNWDSQAVGDRVDEVKIRVRNPESGKMNTVKKVKNSGFALVTFPKKFTGVREFKVEGPAGSVNGTISVV